MDQGLKEAPAPTEEQLAQIKKHKEEQAEQLRRRDESWERSDTDGFLSQWASGLTADLERKKAELLETGGYSKFAVLCDSEGIVIANKIYRFNNTYNYFWKIDEPKYGRRWIPIGEKSRVQKKLGLHEEMRWYPAYACIDGSGTGLSGRAWVAIKKKDEDNAR